MQQKAQRKIFFRWGFLLLIGLLLFAMGSEPLQAQDTEWEARYWNNLSLSGTPVLQRTEAEIDHDWGDASPHPIVAEDDFSAEWIQDVQLSAGNYRFTATTDDGMRIWVDNVQIIDAWYDSEAHILNAEMYLPAGSHQIRVAYYDTGGEAVAKVDWVQLTDLQDDWLAEYYNNAILGGTPVHVRNESTIDLNTAGSPVPQVTANNFSVRWTQDLPLDAGSYRFSVTADDGVRLWVNNNLVVDEWQNQAATTYTAVVNVSGPAVPIRMEYFEDVGAAVAQLSWKQVSGVPSPPVPPATGSWRGEYFNNTSLSGSPVLVRNDSVIDFDWGISSPAPNTISLNRFSVRWTRTFNLAPGAYQLTFYADDGVRVWVDGQRVVDAWEVQSVEPYTATFSHDGGQLPIVIEYFENAGAAEAHLEWFVLGTPPAEPNPTPDSITATMTGAFYLNVRSGPGLAFEPFEVLRQDQTVPVIGRDNFAIWLEVVLPDGTTGWVSSRYMTSDTPFVGLPITQ